MSALGDLDLVEALEVQAGLETELRLAQPRAGSALIAVARLLAALLHQHMPAARRVSAAAALVGFVRVELDRLADIEAARAAGGRH